MMMMMMMIEYMKQGMRWRQRQWHDDVTTIMMMMMMTMMAIVIVTMGITMQNKAWDDIVTSDNAQTTNTCQRGKEDQTKRKTDQLTMPWVLTGMIGSLGMPKMVLTWHTRGEQGWEEGFTIVAEQLLAVAVAPQPGNYEKVKAPVAAVALAPCPWFARWSVRWRQVGCREAVWTGFWRWPWRRCKIGFLNRVHPPLIFNGSLPSNVSPTSNRWPHPFSNFIIATLFRCDDWGSFNPCSRAATHHGGAHLDVYISRSSQCSQGMYEGSGGHSRFGCATQWPHASIQGQPQLIWQWPGAERTTVLACPCNKVDGANLIEWCVMVCLVKWVQFWEGIPLNHHRDKVEPKTVFLSEDMQVWEWEMLCPGWRARWFRCRMAAWPA